jgi:hypothetical protein
MDANGNPLRQGNLQRNALRGFGATQWDLAVHRDFPIKESLRLQFRAELFNVLNHPNFGPPVVDLSLPNFGRSILDMWLRRAFRTQAEAKKIICNRPIPRFDRRGEVSRKMGSSYAEVTRGVTKSS